jgi:hypothetical protein
MKCVCFPVFINKEMSKSLFGWLPQPAGYRHASLIFWRENRKQNPTNKFEQLRHINATVLAPRRDKFWLHTTQVLNFVTF